MSEPSMRERMDAYCEALKRETEIRCPYCDALQENEDCKYPVTYWGEDGPEEMDCDSCYKTFFVDERVSRTYGVGKTKEEAEE